MADLTDDAFLRFAEGLGVSLEREQIGQFREYERLLSEWSGRVRLVSTGDRERLRQRHFLDCLAAGPYLMAGQRLLDLGSGAGLPGVVLHIAVPGIRTALVESARMKALFLREVKARLGLVQLEVFHGRAESTEALRLYGRGMDRVTVRAVGALDAVWQLSEPLLRPGGRMLAFKGEGEADLLRQQAGPQVSIEEVPVAVPGLGRRRSLVFVGRPADAVGG